MKVWTSEVMKWLDCREKEAYIFLRVQKRGLKSKSLEERWFDDIYPFFYCMSNKYVWKKEIINNS